MPAPPDLLVTPAQLGRYGVPSAFLSQFVPVPFLVQISTAGALGTMQIEWQRVGDGAWSAPIVSSGGASWAVTLDDVFADLTFLAATYALGAQYLVDAAGTVTPQAGALHAPTAVLFDLRTNACSAVTTEALMLMRDAIRPPLLTWGDDARMHAAMMVYSVLKRSRGATAGSAGTGDENVFLAEEAGRAFFRHIGENGKPDSMTDTSPTTDGPLIAAYPIGDTLRGW